MLGVEVGDGAIVPLKAADSEPECAAEGPKEDAADEFHLAVDGFDEDLLKVEVPCDKLGPAALDEEVFRFNMSVPLIIQA